MTLSEMEQELKILKAQASAIERILPTLATKQDLRNEVATLATREDLRLATEALQHEIAGCATKDELKHGLEDGKRYTLLLIQATRGEIRQVSQQVASLTDDVRGVAAQVAMMSTHLTGASRQIPAVKPRKRNRK
jgi:DNA repair ATPase RecN